MNRLYLARLSSLTIFLISGCGISSFSERASNPVIHNRAGLSPFENSTDIYATKAGHRMFLIQQQENDKSFTVKKNDGEHYYSSGVEKITVTCAEPSPDVAEAVATAMSDAFALSLKDPSQSIDVQVQNQYAHMLATQMAPLVYRTQGLQLYRNAASDLCVDFMNGLYKARPDEYEKAKQHRFDKSVELIKQEIPHINETAKAFYANAKSGDTKFNAKDLADIVNASKGQAPADPSGRQWFSISYAPTIIEVDDNDRTAELKIKFISFSADAAKVRVESGASIDTEDEDKIIFAGNKVSVDKDSNTIIVNRDGLLEFPIKDLSIGRSVLIKISPINSGEEIDTPKIISIEVHKKTN